MKSTFKYVILITHILIYGCSETNNDNLYSDYISQNTFISSYIETIHNYQQRASWTELDSALALFGSIDTYTKNIGEDGTIYTNIFKNANENEIIEKGHLSAHRKVNEEMDNGVIELYLNYEKHCFKVEDIKRYFGEPNYTDKFGLMHYQKNSTSGFISENPLFEIGYRTDNSNIYFNFAFYDCVKKIKISR